jgi:hypothetical protein
VKPFFDFLDLVRVIEIKSTVVRMSVLAQRFQFLPVYVRACKFHCHGFQRNSNVVIAANGFCIKGSNVTALFGLYTLGRILIRNSQTIDSNMSADTPLLETQYIDIDSSTQVVFDAKITFEWEEGNCQRRFVWAPRAEPNFIATGNEPYVPGTGYARIAYCETRGSIE